VKKMSYADCVAECDRKRAEAELVLKQSFEYGIGGRDEVWYNQAMAAIMEQWQTCKDGCYTPPPEGYIPPPEPPYTPEPTPPYTPPSDTPTPTPEPTPTPTPDGAAPSACMIATVFNAISPRLGVLLPPMRKFRDAFLPKIAVQLYYRVSFYILCNQSLCYAPFSRSIPSNKADSSLLW
jgi:hypothetical protein